MGDVMGGAVSLAEDGDAAGDEELVVADFDDEGELEGDEEAGEEGGDEERTGEEAGEGGVDVGWLSGVTGVVAADLKGLPREHLEALAEAAERYERERTHGEAEADGAAAKADFVEAYGERTGRGMDEVGQMLAEFEDLVAPYAGVEDDGARRSLEAMAWAEVERRHPVEEAEEDVVEKKRKAPGRIRKAGAGNRVAGYGGKRRVSLEGRVVGE